MRVFGLVARNDDRDGNELARQEGTLPTARGAVAAFAAVACVVPLCVERRARLPVQRLGGRPRGRPAIDGDEGPRGLARRPTRIELLSHRSYPRRLHPCPLAPTAPSPKAPRGVVRAARRHCREKADDQRKAPALETPPLDLGTENFAI